MTTSTPEVPIYLDSGDSLADAQHQMLAHNTQPSAAKIELNTSHTPEQLATLGPEDRLDYSLYRQIAQLLGRPLENSDDVPGSQPNCYLLTMYSALPLANTIRSIYTVLELPKPTILPICAAYSDERSEDLKWHNRGFLYKKLCAMPHVCIVDQYTQSGHTVSDALDTCLDMGVPRVSIIRGRWYQDARRGYRDIELPTMSTHANTFTHVGEVIGRALLQKEPKNPPQQPQSV